MSILSPGIPAGVSGRPDPWEATGGDVRGCRYGRWGKTRVKPEENWGLTGSGRFYRMRAVKPEQRSRPEKL